MKKIVFSASVLILLSTAIVVRPAIAEGPIYMRAHDSVSGTNKVQHDGNPLSGGGGGNTTNVIVTGDMRGELIVWKYHNGTFGRAYSDTIPGRIRSIEIGDVNADGENEILVSAAILDGGPYYWRGGLYLYENVNGCLVRTWDTTDYISSVYGTDIGDADDDGKNDNFVAADYDGTVKIYKHQSETYESIFEDHVERAYVARIGDADNDSRNEVLIGQPGLDRIMVYDYQSGTFVNTHNIPTESNVDNLRIGDVDQDGENEIVACGFFNFVSVFEYQSGKYVNVWNSADMGNVFQDCAIGDINNNGKNDIVGFLYNTVGNPSKTIVWEYNGSTYVNIFNVKHDGPHLGMHVGSIGDADNDGETEWTVQEGYNISLWEHASGTGVQVWEYTTGGSPRSEIGEVVCVDTVPPTISMVSQTPLENNVTSEDEVKVNVTATDYLSGIKRMNLNYTNGNGTWFTVDMTNPEGDVWNATIPAFSYCTNVTYVIIAIDNSNNTITTEEIGCECQYHVIPEFPAWTSMLLILIVFTVAIVIYKRKLIKRARHACMQAGFEYVTDMTNGDGNNTVKIFRKRK